MFCLFSRCMMTNVHYLFVQCHFKSCESKWLRQLARALWKVSMRPNENKQASPCVGLGRGPKRVSNWFYHHKALAVPLGTSFCDSPPGELLSRFYRLARQILDRKYWQASFWLDETATVAGPCHETARAWDLPELMWIHNWTETHVQWTSSTIFFD